MRELFEMLNHDLREQILLTNYHYYRSEVQMKERFIAEKETQEDEPSEMTAELLQEVNMDHDKFNAIKEVMRSFEISVPDDPNQVEMAILKEYLED